MTEDASKKANDSNPMELKRHMGLISSTNLIVSSMIGSGIFVSPSSALRYTGSVGMALVIWIISGIICLLAALSFAELGTVVPRSGSEYAFFTDSFGPLHKFWGPLPAFIYSFVVVLVIRPCSVSVILLTSAEYFVEFTETFVCISDELYAKWSKRLIAIVLLYIITYINAVSVKLFVKVQIVFTALKLLVCILIIGGGVYEISIGNIANLQTGFEGSNWSPGNIALALFSGLWAFGGWAAITTATEEMKKPEVNILRSVLCGIPLVTIFYLSMNVAYMTVLTIPEMTNGEAVAITFGQKIFGPFAFIIPLGVTISTFGCAMAIQFQVIRVCFVSAQYGHMLKFLSYIHITKLTPCAAVILQGFLATLVILNGDIVSLIEFASFLFWIAYGLSMISLFILRKTMPDANRPFKAPLFIPVLILITALFLCITCVVADPHYKYLIAGASIGIGVLVYYFFIYNKRELKCLDKVDYFVQVLLQVVPTDTKSK